MGELFPFRFAGIGERYLVTNESGDYFLTRHALLRRMATGQLEPTDETYLREAGFAFDRQGDFHWNSFVRRLARKKDISTSLHYVIAIPTLRCDLRCSYCQVARADKDANGYDWREEQVDAFLRFIDRETADPLKIEFQGGEPSLRLDIVERVVRHCRESGRDASFVICTNLNSLPPALLALLEDPGFLISTSMDGTPAVHRVNRTESEDATVRFFENLAFIQERFGGDKVSALPTITALDEERVRGIVDAYWERGFRSIYLRPVSYHGFARKTHPDSRDAADAWCAAYRSAIRYIFENNVQRDQKMREFGLEVALARIFRPGFTGHVDLRSPNPAAADYIVVDHDGRLYPSDEARMLARIGRHDLSIGDVDSGINRARARALTWSQMNDVHEDCIHCAYQPYCGIDTVDDLARYDRIDLPKHLTWFCRTNEDRFRLIFEMLQEGQSDDLVNLAGHLTGKFELVPFFGPHIHD